MDQITLNPYIFFDGQCKEAMEFYKGVFGGQLTIQTMGEVPEEARAQAMNPDPDRIMHASLEGGGIKLMGSDSAKASAKAAKIELSISGSDDTKLRKIFDSLA